MYAHCKKIYGLNIITAKFETNVPIDKMFADFKTGNITDDLGGQGGAYTGSAENGSTDGEIVYDFKSPVLKQIDSMTDYLIEKGFVYNNVHFHVDVVKEVSAIVMFLRKSSGEDMTGKIYRATGQDYIFLNNDDFDNFFTTGAVHVETQVRTGATLKNLVAEAENTQLGMVSIIGANNDRKT